MFYLRIVVGAEAATLPVVPEDDSFVVGHTGRQAAEPRAPARRTGIVIGKLTVLFSDRLINNT
jgi:hypothetical protein